MGSDTPLWWPWLRLAVIVLAFIAAAWAIAVIIRGGGSLLWGFLIIAAFLGTAAGLYPDPDKK